MQRFVRPCLFVFAVLVLAMSGRAAGPASFPASQPEMQTAVPTGRVVVRYAPAASAADHRRVAALAGAPGEPRFAAATLAAVAARSARSPAGLAGLARYAQFDPPAAGRDDLVRLVQRLAADPAVELAFLEPRAVPAALGFDAFTGASPAAADLAAPLPTPDFTSYQGYLGNAPQGVGAWSVWGTPGARGGSVRIVDVEGAWLWSHEDLPAPFVDLGQHFDDLGWRNHGTAVMGEMRGHDNAFGVDGIVPDCQVGNSSIGDQSVAGALLNAGAHLDAGDLILIELHAPGPNSYEGGGQYGYLPMEFWQDNFDAIRAITDLGILVVEAAGNGQQNLDDAVYQGLFDRDVRDSGAIMVGATAGSSLDPAWFTNHGARVDLCGWGLNVATCAYGDLQGGAETEWYTAQFSGTSSASPIVTGSVASLQGMIEAANGFSVDASLARTILRQTGTPTNGPQLIGPRPNLVAAWTLAAQGVCLLSGTVTEQLSGDPLAGVEIRVQPDGPRTSTAADGSYSVSLLPGTYDLIFTSYFHAARTDDVTVTAGLNVHDTALAVLPLEVIAGTVRGEDSSTLAGARVELIDEPVAPAVADANGEFAFAPVPVGLAHRLLGGLVPGYGGSLTELAAGAPAGAVSVVLPPVDHTFEAGAEGFTTVGSLWVRGNPGQTGFGPGSAFDGAWCWGVGINDGGYPDETTAELRSPSYLTSQFPGDRLFLSFHYWCGTEAGFDGVNVVVNPVTGPVVVLPVDGYSDLSLSGLGYGPGWSGDSGGWRTAVFDISDQLGSASFAFGLRFGSDQAVTAAGFLIDGVSLHSVDTSVGVGEPVADARAGELATWPNPFNPRLNLTWALPAAGRLDLAVFDLRGRLVRELLRDATVADRGQVAWDGTDRTGRAVPSGVYLVRATVADGRELVRRVTLAR
ncbi:MAG TPA: carboxypeptidase regulatory-like domain-containing protein [Candidatus Krumholzibacteria bacterium]|nr:carboxypeptidase regulatory-like domain-containing protein [Candidatus Krumholzibacteria bacterium]HPD70829.1 carboxypeptidase regulatory-like domain-containing protein [Candidatus Krumholzibacteria bacterium]HRY39471.1 carboxypeptidase regulatory-like domain-containing protein [Candidatus Krumholzibacteria bacterium]